MPCSARMLEVLRFLVIHLFHAYDCLTAYLHTGICQSRAPDPCVKSPPQFLKTSGLADGRLISGRKVEQHDNSGNCRHVRILEENAACSRRHLSTPSAAHRIAPPSPSTPASPYPTIPLQHDFGVLRLPTRGTCAVSIQTIGRWWGGALFISPLSLHL
ncbi:hypothetical protein CALVIDRAFT_341854 [Calocera viscosa TUFC12733]|uniref:Secreted protein n=1 Tax=Calocera viscosa (strain TUFC12733) TaxID=1330018 RepID=A0A167HEV4_CALVF|nr:hypothetical protein CALVIDRAFT_341854 [Calocera viscosa TUFC12733]